METVRTEGVISWDECFMRMARLIAQRSKDPDKQCGAVIVDDNNIVLGMGYNGFPRGIDSEALPWTRRSQSPTLLESKHAYIVHAEENAICNTNVKPQGARLYCTMFPCNECAKIIIQTGLKEVIFMSDPKHDRDIWVAARRLFELAGVKTRQYEITNN